MMGDKFIKRKDITMLRSQIEDHLRTASNELTARIEMLEKSLLESKRRMSSLEDSEKRYRRLFESAKDGILILDAETGKVVDVNPFLLQLLGYSYDALHGQYIWELGVFRDIAASKDAFKILQESKYIRYEDLPLETLDGRPIAVEFVSNVYLVDHKKVIQCNIRDITARKRAETERHRLMAAIEQVGEAIVMTDAQGIIQYVNPAFERTTGYSRKEAIGQKARMLKSDKQDGSFYHHLWETISHGESWEGHLVNRRKDGTHYTGEMTISPVRDASNRIVSYVAVQRDITDQLRLATHLQQVQKMEAVGLLAGGVAHDFNNMLTVILGYAEAALCEADLTQTLRSHLEEIMKAANRSAEVTRQLLAFSRKQTITPVLLDLNQTVQGMLKMLRRLIGENIDLAWRAGVDLRPIKIDPMQVDQILANLCVNARDSIADIGKITIEAQNTVLDDSFCAGHDGLVAGEHVLLTVSDNGCGMDKETIDRIFDPFYTTKEVGKGTGLGLSMVFGIVKQNNGFIDVYSEPGKGTTFKIYLPSFAAQSVESRGDDRLGIPLSRGETVLVVDDQPELLKICTMMLEKLGYRVLAAHTPAEAMAIAADYPGEIPLTITDVIMPGMNGLSLTKQLHHLYPRMRFLFMSGYAANVIAGSIEVDEGVDFIQKPFSVKELAVKVRDVVGEGVETND